MNTKRKLKTLTLREKFDVINLVKSGMKKKDVAAQYGLPASTLSTIIKKEAEILLRYESSSNLSCKRRRLAEYPDLEECLLAWFKQCRDKNISVSGPILREKAEEFAKSLGHSSFRASNGWLVNFKKRHELVFRKVCGESASVNNEVCDEWIIEEEEVSEASEVEPDISLDAEWNTLENIEVAFEDYVTCDEGLATTGTLTDAEIIDLVNQNDDDDNVNESDVNHTDPADLKPFISNREARAAINTLRAYVERCNDIDDHVFGSLFELEKVIDKKSANCLNQKKITDFM